MLDERFWQRCAEFHSHVCERLAIGYDDLSRIAGDSGISLNTVTKEIEKKLRIEDNEYDKEHCRA